MKYFKILIFLLLGFILVSCVKEKEEELTPKEKLVREIKSKISNYNFESGFSLNIRSGFQNLAYVIYEKEPFYLETNFLIIEEKDGAYNQYIFYTDSYGDNVLDKIEMPDFNIKDYEDDMEYDEYLEFDFSKIRIDQIDTNTYKFFCTLEDLGVDFSDLGEDFKEVNTSEVRLTISFASKEIITIKYDFTFHYKDKEQTDPDSLFGKKISLDLSLSTKIEKKDISNYEVKSPSSFDEVTGMTELGQDIKPNKNGLTYFSYYLEPGVYYLETISESGEVLPLFDAYIWFYDRDKNNATSDMPHDSDNKNATIWRPYLEIDHSDYYYLVIDYASSNHYRLVKADIYDTTNNLIVNREFASFAIQQVMFDIDRYKDYQLTITNNGSSTITIIGYTYGTDFFGVDILPNESYTFELEEYNYPYVFIFNKTSEKREVNVSFDLTKLN